MLSATNLTKLYGSTTALDSLCLTITPGEIFCLLGANGAGKTTTINLFLNFIPPTSGTATINGINLYRNLTGIENLEYFTAADEGKYSRKQLLEFLRDAGLPGEAAEKRISTYSKGMRQKVGIAIAIAKRAKALLLDTQPPASIQRHRTTFRSYCSE
jgi:ABC-2 type transport system ATP-binding protein